MKNEELFVIFISIILALAVIYVIIYIITSKFKEVSMSNYIEFLEERNEILTTVIKKVHHCLDQDLYVPKETFDLMNKIIEQSK